jgi:ATP synthase protein I
MQAMADIPRKHTHTDAGSSPQAKTQASGSLHDSDYVPAVVLSDEERLQINRRASSGILRSLAAQAVMGCIAVLASWFFAGVTGAGSALIGASAYFVPNAIFALRLLLGLFGASRASPLTFFVGEAFKLGTAVLVLGMAAWLARDWLVWPAMLLGLLSVLKGYVLLLLFRKLP